MGNLDIAMFPWFAVGHFIPYIQLANTLAAGGHRVTLLLPSNAIPKLLHHSLHPSLISFHPVSLPHVDGLPSGAETASEVPLSLNHLLAIAMDLLRHQVHSFLSASKPHLVFFDFAYWIPEIAKHLGLKSVCYHVVSAACIAFRVVPARRVPDDGGSIPEEEARLPPPGFPSSAITLRRGRETLMMEMLSAPFGSGKIRFHERMKRGMRGCDALAIRTLSELEGKFCDYIGAQYGKPVLMTGWPSSPAEAAKLEDRWADWLGKFETGSVVFCAFGSQCFIEKDQFRELVMGLELTGLPFLVALRPPVGCAAVEEALPEGFEERVGERGVVYGGWVQQPLILRHESVGCFVTHGGSGSMMEGLTSGAQMVVVPFLVCQTLAARLLVEELKVAVEVEKRSEDGWFSKESLCRSVESVMDSGSDVGSMVRENRAELKRVIGKPGLINEYADRFVQALNKLVAD